jgi:hypothetical protein
MLARAIATTISASARKTVRGLKVATSLAHGDDNSPAHPPIIRARAIAITTSASARKTVSGLKAATSPARAVTGGIKTTNGKGTMAHGDDSSPAHPPTIHARAIAITTSASVPRTVKGSKAAISPVPIVSDPATTAQDLVTTTEDIATPAHHPIMLARAIATTTSASARKTVRGLKVATSLAHGDDNSPAHPPVTHARVIVTTTSARVWRTAKGSNLAISRASKSMFRCWKYHLLFINRNYLQVF